MTNGYGRIHIAGKHYKAHRLSYELFYGPIKPGLYICHSCDNKRCVNPKHLFAGTPAENMLDKVKKGRQSKNRGEKAGGARLTTEDILEIRGSDLHQRDLAKRFGVHPDHIKNIRRRIRWAHV